MIVMPIIKRMVTSIQLCLMSRMNFGYMENDGKKSINIMYPNEEKVIVVPRGKGVEIIMSIEVCLILTNKTLSIRKMM